MGQPTDERGLGSRNSLRQDLTVSSPFMKILRGGKHFPFEILMGCPYNLTARSVRDNSLGIICCKESICGEPALLFFIYPKGVYDVRK